MVVGTCHIWVYCQASRGCHRSSLGWGSAQRQRDGKVEIWTHAHTIQAVMQVTHYFGKFQIICKENVWAAFVFFTPSGYNCNRNHFLKKWWFVFCALLTFSYLWLRRRYFARKQKKKIFFLCALLTFSYLCSKLYYYEGKIEYLSASADAGTDGV